MDRKISPLIYATFTPTAATTFTAGGFVSGTFTSATPLDAQGIYLLALWVPGFGAGWLSDPTQGVVSGNSLTFSFVLPQAITVEPVTYDVAISQQIFF